LLRGTVAYTGGGNTVVTELGIDNGECFFGGASLYPAPSSNFFTIPFTINAEPLTLNMGGAINQQLRLVNTRDSTSGYLWVDSNGGLNWGSTLIANGPAPP
jgi:hypothetical protein